MTDDSETAARGPVWVLPVRTTNGHPTNRAAWASLTLDRAALAVLADRIARVRRFRQDHPWLREATFEPVSELMPTFYTRPSDYLTQSHEDSFRTVLEQAHARTAISPAEGAAELGRDAFETYREGVAEVGVRQLEMAVDAHGVHWRAHSDDERAMVATGRVGFVTRTLAALWVMPDDQLAHPFTQLADHAPRLALHVLEHGLHPIAGREPARAIAKQLDRTALVGLLSHEEAEIREQALARLGDMDVPEGPCRDRLSARWEAIVADRTEELLGPHRPTDPSRGRRP